MREKFANLTVGTTFYYYGYVYVKVTTGDAFCYTINKIRRIGTDAKVWPEKGAYPYVQS